MSGRSTDWNLRSGLCLKVIMAVAGLLVITGCSGVSQSIRGDGEAIKKGLVARDFLHVLAQILPPNTTTVQLGEPNSSFGRELEKGFREVGYGIQKMEADQGPRFLNYSESARTSSNGRGTTTYSVFVGEIGLERVYAEAGGGIAPIGAMQVFGTNMQLSLNEELFPGQSLEVSYARERQSEIDVAAITIIDKDIMEAITKLRTQSIPSYKSLNSQNQEIENLFRRGRSNFAEVERDYRVVRKDVIVFPDDSLLLLEKGREQIGNLVRFYREGTDVFRLVGCSNGPTKFVGGNEGLALGRSERVAKELVSRKVSQSAILDEGCWAGEAISDFPSRGVVVELQRRNS